MKRRALSPFRLDRAEKTDSFVHMQLRVLSLNIWGVRYIAKFIDQRLKAIIEHLTDPETDYDIVGLQEVNIAETFISTPQQAFLLGLEQSWLFVPQRTIENSLATQLLLPQRSDRLRMLCLLQISDHLGLSTPLFFEW